MAEATIAYVPLNLEESGLLVHLLLNEFHASGLDASRPIDEQVAPNFQAGPILTREVYVAVMERQRNLLRKLVGANNRLLGVPA